MPLEQKPVRLRIFCIISSERQRDIIVRTEITIMVRLITDPKKCPEYDAAASDILIVSPMQSTTCKFYTVLPETKTQK